MFFKIFLALFIPVSSFYTLHVSQLNGSEMDLADAQGKKILIVNVATKGEYVHQISELQQLQQLFQDSLVVLAFPSNSFGNELHSNNQLAQLLSDSFHVNYPVSQISKVRGSNIHPVYAWLADSTQNVTGSINITKDFQKILLDRNGNIIGVFNSMVSPLDSKIQNAIAGN